MNHPSAENHLTFAYGGVEQAFRDTFADVTNYVNPWDASTRPGTIKRVEPRVISLLRMTGNPFDAEICLIYPATAEGSFRLRQSSGDGGSLALRGVKTLLEIRRGDCSDIEDRRANLFPVEYMLKETVEVKSPNHGDRRFSFAQFERTDFGRVSDLNELRGLTDLASRMFKFYSKDIMDPSEEPVWLDVFDRGKTVLQQPKPIDIRSLAPNTRF